jgi:hypothetical protein
MEIEAESGTVDAVPDDERYTELTVYALDGNYNTMS